eukprot:13523046-Alexandrium_andersonii.AAC.1
MRWTLLGCAQLRAALKLHHVSIVSLSTTSRHTNGTQGRHLLKHRASLARGCSEEVLFCSINRCPAAA